MPTATDGTTHDLETPKRVRAFVPQQKRRNHEESRKVHFVAHRSGHQTVQHQQPATNRQHGYAHKKQYDARAEKAYMRQRSQKQYACHRDVGQYSSDRLKVIAWGRK